MNIIILILANDDGFYPQCQSLWKSYMNTHPHIKSYFIKYKDELSTNVVLDNDTIYIKGKETLIPGCLDKTIKSIQFILNEQCKFDYVFRTNMSSVVNLEKLYKHVQQHSYGYAGINGNCYGTRFISGAGILMNKEVCNLLVENHECLNYNIIDDVAIGYLFNNLNIQFDTLTRIDTFEDELENVNREIIQNNYHFRCKAKSDYKNTLDIMKKIISIIYNETIVRDMYVNLAKQNLSLLMQNKYPNKNSSDICEHLITLYNYAKNCDSVFETGVRGCISSWAFLNGLNDNCRTNKKHILLNDIDECNIADLMNVAEAIEVDVQYTWKNNLELDITRTYDIVFIDTWHVYGQLKRELENFSKISNKYIIMHDTTVDEIYGETIRNSWDALLQSKTTGIPVEEINKGLWPAIEEFIEKNNDWYIKERFTNNNGLTILARKTFLV